ncbi:glycosyl transferase family 1 [Halorubrum sp. Ea1]|uniref:glycosyltransferase family 4 protein n=1 Tax=Halorubrum sp. Ea1 TaxID=1480718 RepID=UPI000B998DA3|nr:glycosyltransferase family 4 protein [Halorubrum sp. Ea1]OYR54189.1 glycosyl transferase family 1 [Halorubrum sp. Ea1]
MTEPNLDVGFVPVECPGQGKTGAANTSSLLIETLSHRHDLTVYVVTQQEARRADLPARDRVEYVVQDDLSMLPHPIATKQDALRSKRAELEGHDLVHSYSSAFIPTLATLDCPTLATLNSYLAVCPTASFRYHGRESCSGPGPLKCAGCVPATAINRRNGAESETKAAYLAAGRAPLVKESIERCDEVTAYQALSPHLRDDYVGVGFDRDRIRVIPHFYDERFCAEPPETKPARPRATAEDPVRLLYAGSLRQIKGVDVLFRALPALSDRGVEAELHVAGTGPLEDRLREIADTLGTGDRIVWHGFLEREELASQYRKADAFVYPGVIDEPFGRVMLEALASRTPIVSSDTGSMAAIVGDAGVLFEPGDEERLAAAVERLIAEYPARCDAIGDQLATFAPETVLEEFCDLYRETVETADRSGR